MYLLFTRIGHLTEHAWLWCLQMNSATVGRKRTGKSQIKTFITMQEQNVEGAAI
jgi:uncharacterized protein YmfQ (DUF2313 family)